MAITAVGTRNESGCESSNGILTLVRSSSVEGPVTEDRFSQNALPTPIGAHVCLPWAHEWGEILSREGKGAAWFIWGIDPRPQHASPPYSQTGVVERRSRRIVSRTRGAGVRATGVIVVDAMNFRRRIKMKGSRNARENY